jgi:tRNA-dihydrouridine synthase B
MIDFDLASLISELNNAIADCIKECLSRFPFLNMYAVEYSVQTDNGQSNNKQSNLYLSKIYDDIFKNFNEGKSSYSSFKIGNVLIKNPLVSAPLAGISDNTYRIMAKAFGAALTFSEMITGYGICYRHRNSLELAEITEFERPCGVQIFGSDPDIISEAARIIEPKADVVDINMGCSVAKVLKSKSGGYLLQDEEKIKSIISRVTSAVKKPVTVKVRIGWDKNSINILKVAEIAESCGASAVTIHGRTVKQGFSGEVNYEIIKQVKEKIKIPVIISGDIDSPEKAIKVLNYTECDALMIGRASKGSVWIFLDILISLLASSNRGFQAQNGPDINWKKKFAIIYLKFLIYFKGEEKAVKEFRKYLSWIFRGVRGVSRIKTDFFKVITFSDVENAISYL